MTSRREFITLLSGAATTWPLAARAQQGERMRRIGVLMSLAANDPEASARLTAFVQRLQQLGWTVGRNVQIDYRWAADPKDFRKYGADLVALELDIILSTLGVTAVLQATRSVSIVFLQGGRSGWQRLRREPGAARRKRYRLYHL
jgi:putative ABC transport system substrate-binding protein